MEAGYTGFYYSLLGFNPGFADTHVDFQWRVELPGAGHLAPGEFRNSWRFRFGRLEDQLIMHLEDDPRLRVFLFQFAGPVDPGTFYYVGGAALGDGIKGEGRPQAAGAAGWARPPPGAGKTP